MESEPHLLLFDVILVCWGALAVSNKRENTQLFLLALSPPAAAAAESRNRENGFNNREAFCEVTLARSPF